MNEIPKRPGPDPQLVRLLDAMRAGSEWATRTTAENPSEHVAAMLDLDMDNPAHVASLIAFQQVVVDAVGDEDPIPSAFAMGLAVGLALWGPIGEPSVALRVEQRDPGGDPTQLGLQMEFAPPLPFDLDETEAGMAKLPLTHVAAMAMANRFIENHGGGQMVPES